MEGCESSGGWDDEYLWDRLMICGLYWKRFSGFQSSFCNGRFKRQNSRRQTATRTSVRREAERQ